MHDENAPSFSEFVIAVSGLLFIAAVSLSLVIFAFLCPLQTALFVGVCCGCGTLYSGVRFVSRILDPRDAKRPADAP